MGTLNFLAVSFPAPRPWACAAILLAFPVWPQSQVNLAMCKQQCAHTYCDINSDDWTGPLTGSASNIRVIITRCSFFWRAAAVCANHDAALANTLGVQVGLTCRMIVNVSRAHNITCKNSTVRVLCCQSCRHFVGSSS